MTMNDKSTIGTFIIIKNEIPWIRAHLASWLPHVDEMVFFDGNSTDGTLEAIREAKNGRYGEKIVLVEGKDPVDLAEDYVRIFDECLHTLKTDYAVFAHPDMLLDDPGQLRSLGGDVAYFSTLRSFAAEPGGQLYEIKEGRTDRWKNIYRLRRPDLGLHYFGFYGAQNEDCYFSKITGSEHVFHGDRLDRYPYPIGDSGVKIFHFSDVRPYARRFSRMVSCLINQGYEKDQADEIASKHPRVTLQDGRGFKFIPCEYPELLKEAVNV